MSKRNSCFSEDYSIAAVLSFYWCLRKRRAQVAYKSRGTGALQTSGFKMVSLDFMAATSRRHVELPLPAMRRDLERRLVQQNAVVGIGRIGASWSA